MIIEELEVDCGLRGEGEGDLKERKDGALVVVSDGAVVMGAWDAKRVFVGAGARALFYPTLLYNVLRNKFQAEFRWWDRIGEYILLGAVPFPADVPRLKAQGVQGVITLNEPYETLVPSSLYRAFGIDHLVLPTRDYCFAPSLADVSRAVEFIHERSLRGQTVYVHCKAGRGRSTTIVLCYLVHHRSMTPIAAYNYVKSIRPRVLLASAQWQAVQEYYNLKVKSDFSLKDLILRCESPSYSKNVVAFDDCSVVVVSEADLDGYDPSLVSSVVGNDILAGLSVVCRVGIAGQAALARISCFWRSNHKVFDGELGAKNTAGTMRAITVDIHIY